jgi:hypothetical protein
MSPLRKRLLRHWHLVTRASEDALMASIILLMARFYVSIADANCILDPIQECLTLEHAKKLAAQTAEELVRNKDLPDSEESTFRSNPCNPHVRRQTSDGDQ